MHVGGSYGRARPRLQHLPLWLKTAETGGFYYLPPEPWRGNTRNGAGRPVAQARRNNLRVSRRDNQQAKAVAIPDATPNHAPAAGAGNLILIYMGASRWQGRFVVSGGQVAVLYPACWCRTSYLLALMESADPHLICRPSSTLRTRFRFGGSRSDLFAFTPCRALRNLSEATSRAGSFLPSPSAVTPAG